MGVDVKESVYAQGLEEAAGGASSHGQRALGGAAPRMVDEGTPSLQTCDVDPLFASARCHDRGIAPQA